MNCSNEIYSDQLQLVLCYSFFLSFSVSFFDELNHSEEVETTEIPNWRECANHYDKTEEKKNTTQLNVKESEQWEWQCIYSLRHRQHSS